MANKIIGSGLLAQAFIHSGSDECLFFCSGVSNSNETSERSFKREELLLKKNLEMNVGKCFVYFSSILAPLKQNIYFQHKIRMEEIIIQSSSEYLILRLPQVAGAVLNTTLLSTFIMNIYEDKEFVVYKNAERTLIDVDDAVKIFDIIHDLNEKNKVVNLCPGYSFTPEELIFLISKHLEKKALFYLVDKGSIQKYKTDNSTESNKISEFFDAHPNYLEDIVKKYTPKIVKLIEMQA